MDPHYPANVSCSVSLQVLPLSSFGENAVYFVQSYLYFFKTRSVLTVCSFSVSLVPAIGSNPHCVNQWSKRMPLTCSSLLIHPKQNSVFRQPNT